MNTRLKTLKSIIIVALSNCSTIFSGIIIGFLIPKILSVESYGLYKTFTLYTTYIGFFSLGIIDGIVLDYGEYNYEQLNQKRFRTFFRWYTLVHLIGATVLVLISLFTNDINFKFIILMLGMDMLAVNVTGYFQQISQFTQRFNEFSARKIIQAVLNTVIVIVMYVWYIYKGEVSYQIYVIALVIMNVLLTMWYVYTYRQIIFGKAEKLNNTKEEIVHLIKIGFPLLFANLCATLILTLDRQFVNVLFDTSVYAVYAFAYNMLSLVTVATSAIATVLYPTLKRSEKKNMLGIYSKLIAIMLIFVFMTNVVYFPLSWFIKWFLPKYTGSLLIFRIIFPGLAISSSITVVMHNYYKVLGENLQYFIKSLIVLGISACANWLAYIMFKTPAAISIASIITMIVWYIIIEQYFVKKFSYNRVKNFLYMLLMMLVFYVTSGFINMWIAGICYILLYILLTFLFYHELLIKEIRKIKK